MSTVALRSRLLGARRLGFGRLMTARGVRAPATTSSAKRYRCCPVCGSAAVSAATYTDLRCSRHRWSARCGQCATWRTDVLRPRDTRQLLCGLASDRACMEEALARSRWTDPARELGEWNRALDRAARR